MTLCIGASSFGAPFFERLRLRALSRGLKGKARAGGTVIHRARRVVNK
jgi:hypothetical protein